MYIWQLIKSENNGGYCNQPWYIIYYQFIDLFINDLLIYLLLIDITLSLYFLKCFYNVRRVLSIKINSIDKTKNIAKGYGILQFCCFGFSSYYLFHFEKYY